MSDLEKEVWIFPIYKLIQRGWSAPNSCTNFSVIFSPFDPHLLPDFTLRYNFKTKGPGENRQALSYQVELREGLIASTASGRTPDLLNSKGLIIFHLPINLNLPIFGYSNFHRAK